MNTLPFFLTQCVNALSQAALLFFLGVGLTLIFGIMRIVNFAHGALYMLGAFVGYSLAHIDRQLLGRVGVGADPGRGVRHGVRTRHPAPPLPARRHAFLMVTFGLALVLGEAVRLIWGPDALQVNAAKRSPASSSCSTSRSRSIACSLPPPASWWRSPSGSSWSARASAC